MTPTAAKKLPTKVPLRVVQPAGEMTGCLWCPLLSMSPDFGVFAPKYQRNAEKILGALKEPHEVRTRAVSEPWTKVDILFVGEAPGIDEDKKGTPFVGRSGNLLRGTVDKIVKALAAETGDTVSLKVGYANVVRCRPPLNRDPARTEIQACSPELEREIKARDPKVVVPLGNFSLDFFTGRKGILLANGKLMRCKRPGFAHLKVVPCVHPAYVLRADHEYDKFAQALTLAFRVAAGDYKELAGEGQYFVLDGKPKEVADLAVELLAAFRADKAKLAFDTETGNRTPTGKKFPRILSFHFSNQEGVGYTIPWDHKDSPLGLNVPPPTIFDITPDLAPDKPRKGTKKYAVWSEQNEQLRKKELARRVQVWSQRRDLAKTVRPKVEDALRELFADPEVPKVAQNGKFDDQHIYAELGVWPANVRSDTMLKHMLVQDQRGSHGLEHLAFSHTGMGGYHDELDLYIKQHPECQPDKGGSYANIPGELLFPYGAQDADATLRVDNELDAEPEYASSVKLQRLASHYFPILSRTLAKMEYAGAAIDITVVQEMDAALTKEAEAATLAMKALPQVKAFVADKMAAGRHGQRKADPFDFNPGSDKQIREILFSYYQTPPTEMTDGGFKLLAARYNRLKQDNPQLSFADVQLAAIEKGEWDFFSVKADVLHDYDRAGVDLAPVILNYRRAEKLLGTYVQPMYDRLDENGCVHGSFLVHGTVTGRLSSADPNLQNIPPYAKRAFVSRWGREGVILSADYSQIELRVAACIFKEPKMIKAYLEGADLHTLTAIGLSGLTPAEYYSLPKAEQKKWRVRAKRCNFGILYGSGPPGIVNALRKDGVFITLEEATGLRDMFYTTYPTMIANMKKLSAEVARTGQLESFTGRIRRLPEVWNSDEEIVARALRQSINFPIQSGAGDITLIALCLCQQRFEELNLKSKLILTVHDQIVADCPLEEALTAATEMRAIMQNVPKLSASVLPGLDWSWLQVPLAADFDIGFSWGQTVEFDPEELDGRQVDKPLHWQEDDGLKYRRPYSVDELAELIDVRASA